MIVLQNLRLLRGNTVVLENFSATLLAGQGAWLLGANGSGKTSLLRACAGLLPPLDGTVDCTADKIFIGSALGHDAALTCEQNLQFWCDTHGVLAKTDALARVGLNDFKNKVAGELSAGQAQRLALARLLCSAAPLWLLDEPFSALDTAGQVWLCDVMKAHIAQGGVVLCATHQLYDIPTMQRWQL